MSWRRLAWGLVGCVVLAVGFLIWPPTGPPLKIEIPQRGGKVQLVRDEALLIGVTLDGPQFGDADAAKLAQVSSLQNVSFNGSAITHEGVRRLLPLSGLRSLNLSHTQLVPSALDDVARFTSLRQLHLAGCRWFQDDDLRRLRPLQQLEELNLSETTLGAVGVEHLRQLPSLLTLTLVRCPTIRDETVDQLASLSQLKQLTLSSTELTSRGYRQLCQRLPNVKVIVPPESLKDLRDVAQRGRFTPDLSGFSQQTMVSQLTNRDQPMVPLLPGDLTVIGSLPGLRYLSLQGEVGEITDEMFLELGPLPQLESLGIRGTRITDAALQRLEGFPSLKRLSIFPTQINGPGLKHLEHTPGLTRLEICTQQGDEVLEYLAPLQNLDELIIGAPITDEGLDRMPVLAKLRVVWFNDSQVRGPGIESLSRQPSLISLSFGRGAIDDTVIEHIAKLTSLRSVSLGQMGVTEEGKARLRSLCPNLEVR